MCEGCQVWLLTAKIVSRGAIEHYYSARNALFYPLISRMARWLFLEFAQWTTFRGLI
jgi:hypothetical protein